MFLYPDIDPEILNIAAQKEKELAPVFEQIQEINEANQYKILSAFQKTVLQKPTLMQAPATVIMNSAERP